MDRTNEIIQGMIVAAMAIVVIVMIMVPMVNTSVNQTVDGEEHTIDNAAIAVFKPYTGTDPIVITFDGTNVTNESGLTDIVTDSMYVNVNGNTVTVWDANGKTIWAAENTLTLTASQVKLVNTIVADVDATYGQMDVTGVYVDKDSKLYVYNEATFAAEKYNGTGIALTYAETDYDGVYEITAVAGTNPGIFAPLSVTYYDQEPAMDDSMKSIITIIPLLVIIGLLMACVYMFISRRNA